MLEFPSNGTLIHGNNTSSVLALPGDTIKVICPEGYQMFTRDYKLVTLVDAGENRSQKSTKKRSKCQLLHVLHVCMAAT